MHNRKSALKKLVDFFAVPLLLLDTGIATWAVKKDAIEESRKIDSSPSRVVCLTKTSSGENIRYTNIEMALSKANSGDTVYVLPGTVSLSEDSVIKEGVSLALAYSFDASTNVAVYFKESNATNNDNFADVDEETNLKTNLIIESGKKLTVNGNLYVGGILGYSVKNSNQRPSGHTTSSYAQISMKTNSEIDIGSTGFLDTYGFIKAFDESSTGMSIKNSGGKITQPIVVYDWKGGGNALGNVNNNLFPFNIYDIPNIQVPIHFSNCATMYGHARVAGTGFGVFSPDLGIIANNGILKLFDKAEVIWSFKRGTLLTTNDDGGTVNVSTQNDNERKLNISISGKAIIKTFDKISGQDVSECPLPISFVYSFNLVNAEVEVNANVRFLTGSSMEIDNQSSVTMNKNVIFLSEFEEKSFAVVYPSGLKAASLISYGELRINSGFGGTIDCPDKSKISNKTKVIAENQFVDSVTAIFGDQEGAFATWTQKCSYTEYAKLYGLYANDESVLIKKNQSYFGHSSSEHLDGLGGIYPITYENVTDVSGFDVANVTNNNPSVFSDTISLSEPTYGVDDVVIFGGFYSGASCSSDSLLPLSTDISLNDHLASIVDNGHAFHVYVKWVDASLPKSSYQIRYLDDSGNVLYTSSTATVLIGDTVDLSQYNPSLEMAYDDTNSCAVSYEFDCWKANETEIDSYTFTSDDESQTVYLNAVFKTTKYPYPTISSYSNDPTASLSLNGGSYTFKVTVSNYDESIFEFDKDFVSDSSVVWTLKTPEDEGEYELNLSYGYAKDDSNIGNQQLTFSCTVKNNCPKNSDDETKNNTLSFSLLFKIKTDKGDFSESRALSKEFDFSWIYSSCLLPTAQILMANGTFKNAGDLRTGDMVMSFNHETGQIESTPIITNDDLDSQETLRNVVHLEFDNRNETDLVSEHGYFDLTTNKYEYINEANYQSFVGHEFAFIDPKGKIGNTTLVNAYVYQKMTKVCSPVSGNNLNIVADNMLSIAGGIEGLFNIFEYDPDTLAFDKDKMDADIKKYGLLDYEYFEQYFPREIYDLLPCKYMGVSIGKGLISWETIEKYIDKWKDQLLENL